ncbi:MAG: hypothetical protein ACRD1N_00400 [Terriglobia bacterium]
MAVACWLCTLSILLIGAAPRPIAATKWETLFTAQDVRDHLSTVAGREQALDFCRRMGISKVYVEAFRDGYQADATTLREARDFFRQAGLEVSGCVMPTGLGKRQTAPWPLACLTNRANQAHLNEIFRFTASLFNEIMIDDAFATACTCSECTSARGTESWQQYRKQLKLKLDREDVLAAARAVNPRVRIILKFPQWYDDFQNRGYWPAEESALYPRIWVGTELRSPSSQKWGHKQQYEGFFIYRWLRSIAGSKTGGGWFDPFGTTPVYYLDQAYVTVLAGAPEIMLFYYGGLSSPEYQPQAAALAAHREELDALAKLAGNWRGIPAYKPNGSDPGSEPYIFDEIGMLGIPLLPVARFPAGARAAIFAESALGDARFVPELARFLEAGGTAFATGGLAHRVNADPRLPSHESVQLAGGALLKTVSEGAGRLIIFSDELARLTFVDSANRVAQLTPETRKALENLRNAVSPFTVTSQDAPPRVAIFPMQGRVAVMNFTELPVACHLEGQPDAGHRLEKVFATSGAELARDGSTLDLPPHALLMVR